MVLLSLYSILNPVHHQPCVYANYLTWFFLLHLSNKFTTYLLTIAVYKMHDTHYIKIIDAQKPKLSTTIRMWKQIIAKKNVLYISRPNIIQSTNFTAHTVSRSPDEVFLAGNLGEQHFGHPCHKATLGDKNTLHFFLFQSVNLNYVM